MEGKYRCWQSWRANRDYTFHVPEPLVGLFNEWMELAICYDGQVAGIIADWCEDHPEQCAEANGGQEEPTAFFIAQMREVFNKPSRNETARGRA